MLITVTKHDIDFGIQENCQLCPVARAIHRIVPCRAEVFSMSVEFFFGKEHISIPLPKDVTKRIRRFDRDGVMEPFEFNLNIDLFCEVTFDCEANSGI